MLFRSGVSYGYVYYNNGTSWLTGNNGYDWNSSSLSADGTKGIVSSWGWRLYLLNAGTWTETRPAGDVGKAWSATAMSSDGTKIMAAVNGGNVYQTSDGGTTWTITYPAGATTPYWQSLAMSADGSKRLAAANGGRIYYYSGGSWSEIYPNNSNVNQQWVSVSMSADGSTMLAAINPGRVFLYSGGSWAEVQPAGNTIKNWKSVAVSADGVTLLAAAWGDRLYCKGTQSITSITGTTATGNANIVATNGSNATNRGYILYPYSNTDKIIGETNVTQFDEAGDFTPGNFSESFTGLSVNTHYNAKAYAINTYGTRYGARVEFYTLANVPDAPTVNSPTVSTMNVIVNPNGNPAATEFCIFETSTSKFVQADGSLGATAVWQTVATWGTKTVTGLNLGLTYTYKVKARNGNLTVTAYGAEASSTTVGPPTMSTYGSLSWSETQPAGNGDKYWSAVATNADGTRMLAATNITGRIYYSSNSGKTWIEVFPTGVPENKDWSALAISGNSWTMIAAVNGGKVYQSTNLGSTWTEIMPAGSSVDKSWYSASLSYDGLTGLIGVLGGRVYYQRYGSWSEVSPAGGGQDKWWQVVRVSQDGSTLLAANDQRIYTAPGSSSSSWTEIQPAGDVNKDWRSVSLSNNGQKMIAAANNSRLYLFNGSSWSETQPAGDVDKAWYHTGISSDGTTMLAGVYGGRLCYYTSGAWSETQPAGDADKNWNSVTMSPGGSAILAGVFGGRLFRGSFPFANNITSGSATLFGNITAVNGSNATTRGILYYNYTGSPLEITDPGVLNVSEDGNYGIGAYSLPVTGLSPNVYYNTRAFGTNLYGTGYGNLGDFWTLAAVPAAPTVNTPTTTTLNVSLGYDGNSSNTQYCIYETSTNKFVQADGTLGSSAVWQVQIGRAHV